MADEENAPAAGGGNTKLVIIIALSTVISCAAAVGITLALAGGGGGGDEEVVEGEAAEKEAPPESFYIDLEPEFVINFQDKNNRPKFLKAEMSVVTNDEEVEEQVAKHMPAIRNNLVLLLSRQYYEDLVPHEGKEKLRGEALAEVQRVLEERIGDTGVSELYFSNFVMH